MDDIKEMIQSTMRSYERDRDNANKEIVKQSIMRDCYNEFIYVLQDILEKIEKR